MHTIVTPASDPALKKRALGIVFLIMLLDIVGLTIIIPVAPFVVGQFSDDALMVTLLTGIYAAAQFLAAPAIGKISDRVGRRRVLLLCVLGSAAGYVMFGVGGALWILFLSRVIDGITGGNLATAAACIADISTPEERPQNFALIGMAFGLGFIAGPALGGAASQFGINAPAFTAAVLALISAGVIYFLLPESLPAEARESAPLRASDFNPFVAIGEMARKPGLAMLIVVNCLFAFGFDGMNSVMSVYVVDRFAAEPWQIGLLFVVAGVITAFTQAVLVPRVVARTGEKPMAIVSQLGLALGAIVIVLVPSFLWLYPNQVLLSGIGGFVWSTIGALAASKVLPHEQGRLAGVNTALQSLMTIAGPLAAGATYDAVAPTAPFWVSAGVFLLAALVMARVRVAPRSRNTAPAAANAAGH